MKVTNEGDLMERSKKIKAWLRSHPFFSKNAMCKGIGYDQSSLSKKLNDDKPIPSKHIDDIEKILKEYGYDKSK